MELNKTVMNEKKLKVLFEKQIVINYDLSFKTFIFPSSIKSVSEDIAKVKVLKKGMWSVNLVLLDAGNKLTHLLAKEMMLKQETLIEPAGLHEIVAFSHFLGELNFEKFSVTALRDEMFERGVEFIPTLHGTKKAAHLVTDFLDDLPFKKTYFLGVFDCNKFKH